MKHFRAICLISCLLVMKPALGNFTTFELSGLILTNESLVYKDQGDFSIKVSYEMSQGGITQANYIQYSGFGRFEYLGLELVEDHSLEVRVYNDYNTSEGIGNPGFLEELSDIDLVSFHFSSNLFETGEISGEADDGLVFVLTGMGSAILSDSSLPSFSLVESLFNNREPELGATGQFYQSFSPTSGDLFGTAILQANSIVEVSAVPEPRSFALYAGIFSIALVILRRR